MSTRYPRPRDRGPSAPGAPAPSARDAGPAPYASASYQNAPYAYAGAAAPNAALLIDFDNVTMGVQKDLQAELRALLSSDIIRGRVLVRRAYADWRRYPNYVVPLTENSIDLIYAPAYGASKKNATDIRLAIDAMELVFTRAEIGTYILLSGDSDFSSLVIKLKEYGKYVIGVGIRESASDLLVQNCDEYYSYNALAGLVRTADEIQTPRDPWELVVDAVDRMARNGDTMRADRLKQVMQDIDATFDEKNLGMPKFSRFVSEAAARGLLTLTRLESGQYEIAPARPGTSRDAGRDRGREPARESFREPAREPARDVSRDVGRDREVARPNPRDAARDFARDLARDPRDVGRDASRDLPRDLPRDTGRADAFDPTDAELADRAFDEGPGEDESTGEPASRVDRFDRSRPRRGRGRSGRGRDAERGPRADEFAPTADDFTGEERVAPEPRDIAPLAIVPTIGAQGERLTRAEAFDVVRRAVEALTTSETDRVAEQPLREQVFALLGRDSESLSERMFPRIVQDASDNGVVRTFRSGDTLTAGRVPRPAPTAGDDATATAAAARPASPAAPPVSATPVAPRGMGPRGVARGRGGRLGAPPPELLLIGAVPTGTTPAAASTGSATADFTLASADDASTEAASTVAPTLGAGVAGDDGGTPDVPTATADAGSATNGAADAPDVTDASGDVGGLTDGAANASSGTDAVDDEPASGDDATTADDAELEAEPAAAARSRRGRSRGRGRGGAGRAAAAEAAAAAVGAAPANVAQPAAAPEPAAAPQADAGAPPAAGRGARKGAAKVAAKAPAKTAAKQGARKRAPRGRSGGGDTSA